MQKKTLNGNKKILYLGLRLERICFRFIKEKLREKCS